MCGEGQSNPGNRTYGPGYGRPDGVEMAEMVEPGPRRGMTVRDASVDVAYRALLEHATHCRRCVANWRECATRRALSDTLRQVR